MEDNAIVELYFARSEQAIRETEQKYGAYLNTIATNILHLPEDAEETVSDTYLAAWNAIPPTRPRVLRHFLSRIVRNKAFQRYSYLTAAKRCAETDVLLSEIEDCLPDGRQDTARRMEQRVITQSINAFWGVSPERSRAFSPPAIFTPYHWSKSPKPMGIPCGKFNTACKKCGLPCASVWNRRVLQYDDSGIQ